MQTDEEQSHFNESAEIIIGEDEFKRRIRNFFGEHGNYADVFIAAYFAEENNPDVNAEFPEGMVAYIWIHSDDSNPKVYNLDEIEEIAPTSDVESLL